MSKVNKKGIGSEPHKILYRDGLKDVEKVRYDEKLKLLGGSDPYEIDTWSTDVSLLPPVTFLDIINYLIWTPSVYTKDELKSYKGLDAYNQFVNGWVRERSTVVCNDYTVVTAKVLHSQRMREKPLRPWIISDKSGQVKGAHCTCMAGLGEACSHVAALLFAIDATVRIRDSKTVTDEKAYWLLPSTMKSVEYKKIQEIDFTSATTAKRKFTAALDEGLSPISSTQTTTPPLTLVSRMPRTPGSNPRECKVPESSDDEMKQLFQTLYDSGSRACILSIVEPFCDSFIPAAATKNFPQVLSQLRDDKCDELNYKQLVDHCETLTISCTKEQSTAVEFSTRSQSKCKLWNSFRAGRITASRMKTICHTNLASPAPSLIKGICYPDTVKFQTDATKWGCEHEKLARDQFLESMSTVHENCQIEDVGFMISTEHPFIGASPDGIFSCDCCGKATVEIKCPFCVRNENLDQCKYLQNRNGVLSLNQDHDYYYQVQTQLGCSDIDIGYFVVWTERDLHIEEIAFNKELWKHICDCSRSVFTSAILPELVGKFYSKIPQLNRKPLVPSISKNIHNSEDSTSTNTNNQGKAVNVESEELFCYCEQVEHGKMIACDNSDCEIEWFHYACVKIDKSPRGKWYCPDCRKLPKFKRQKKSGNR